MIFAKKKKILVWCDDPPEDRVISIVAGCLANHDRAHSPIPPGTLPKDSHTRQTLYRYAKEDSSLSQNDG